MKKVGQPIFATEFLPSKSLSRQVQVDFYQPIPFPAGTDASLILFNDGQLLAEMNFSTLLQDSLAAFPSASCLVAGIHAGPDRLQEYGTAAMPDFAGRGARAGAYTSFVLDELLPFIGVKYAEVNFAGKTFAGFSLGGLSALDIVWNHPDAFAKAAVFSGALWWRKKDIGKGYCEDRDRIMHQQVKEGVSVPGLQFFFECGTDDERMDRNKNGIIDSIDDTLDLIRLLQQKGYPQTSVCYLQMEKGQHNVLTWKKAMPTFLQWCLKTEQ